MTATNCPACKALSAMGMQCNHHRKTAPSATTLRRSAIVRHMRETGATAAEAEAHFGVTAGPVVR